MRAGAVRISHSRPYHPQTCGKVERFHEELVRWLPTWRPTGASRSVDWGKPPEVRGRPRREDAGRLFVAVWWYHGRVAVTVAIKTAVFRGSSQIEGVVGSARRWLDRRRGLPRMEVLTLPIRKTSTCLTLPASPALT